MPGATPHRADLHTHSAVSDGTDAPAGLIRAAAAAGLDTVALTDHDTTAGWAEAAAAAPEAGVRLVPGLELSTRSGGRSIHMLGYLVDPGDSALSAEMERIRLARRTRAESIVARLAADYEIGWQDVLAQAREESTIGRPHIADALVARGIVPDRSAAFSTLLHPAAGYYEPLYAPTPLDGVRLIRGAGGVPVMAHPATWGRTGSLSFEEIEHLVDAGLAGLELHHRENTAEGREVLGALARARDLIVTGSSDYHGSGKPNRLGENTTDERMLERIVEQAHGTEVVGA